MTTQAFYQLSTGRINWTLSPGITDQNQLSALQSQGIGMIIIPDGNDANSGIVDISNNQFVLFQASSPIPDLTLQYIAAQINAGIISSSSFHPATIAEMNSQLTSAKMTPVK